MGRKKEDKVRINISLDRKILNSLKDRRIKPSVVINNLLKNHLSLYSNFLSQNFHNPEVVGSNPTFAI
jgi:hypothetical protein